MPRFAARQRVRKHLARLFLAARREVLDWLDLTFQLEAEVIQLSLQDQRRFPALAVVYDGGLTTRGVAPEEVHRKLCAFDRGARISRAVGEIAQFPRDGSPATAHARLAHARFFAPRSLLIDHEVERHVLAEQLREEPARALVGHRHFCGQWHAEPTKDAGHAERCILDGLHQHTSAFRPLADGFFMEQVARQSVHLAHETRHPIRLGIHVVCGQVVAARHDQAFEIALLARHSVQAFDAGHDREKRDRRVVRVDQQFRPFAFHGHGFHGAAIARQPSLLDDAAAFQELHGAPIGNPVQWHGEVELIGRDAEISACDSHPFRIARELEFGRRGPEGREIDVPVAEDEHASAGNTAVDAARHLENLVCPQMQLGEHILSALDDGGETRVIDDDGVQSVHIQCALSRGGHREEVRLRLLSLQKGSQHADRLAAVVVCRVDARSADANVFRGLLHTLARRDEHGDAALFLVDALQELVVQKLADVLAEHLHLCRLGRVERVHLEHIRAGQIAAVKRWVDGGRKPDEAAAHPLAERQA